jgi:predicted GNAT family acetyltransferase
VPPRERQNPAIEVVHAPELRRYEITVDGEAAGFTEYLDRRGERVFIHTETDRARAGQGLATRLIREALDDTRRTGMPIVARCPFVAAFVKRHPEYATPPQG